MAVLVWDDVADREFETGLDRGVLYPPEAPAVPWNGLTSIMEKFEQQRQPIYFDGMKINDLITLGDFEGTMKAVTYPDEFTELEGMSQANPGMFLGNQRPEIFGLSYRTLVGNAVDGETAAYKIHILYNVTAVPADRTWATLTDSPTLVEFEWDISAVPEEVTGFRPTAHIVINSKDFDPDLLSLLEDILYGTETTDPGLIPMGDLLVYLLSWFGVIVVDNGDGTWTASSSQPVGSNPITFPSSGQFAISEVTGVYLNSDTYQISSPT